MASQDITQRFLFENADVRGEMVSADQSYREILAKHTYPEPVKALLGEMLAAAVLLSTTIKFDGLLILQAKSEGPLSTLMVECSSDQAVRGIARYADDLEGGSLDELMPGGVLAITIDPDNGQRYQGVVSLEGGSLAAALDGYFANSEQLATRFRLQADGRTARGFLLQALPADRQPDPEQRADTWQHLNVLADTLKAEELIGLDNETVLHRLFHQEELRLFDAQPVRFECSCSADRSGNALVSLGKDDVLALLQEQGGCIEIDCQFCNARYPFDADAIESLFAAADEHARQLH
ncbi:MAG TPA: Hsp33 family molecular chaperone HslO [Pseudomonas sabulinigri]|uniref:33 kDa chaperonin n=1 Tax=marine sediment metagenome TaxID=412755 RepID=A0A0F9VT53_9ZZZZ|nr:Hsp33 family molecular chaperone HslO [Halopseudomonas sabulinigri]HEC52233.1 Hsp33 family molecular chaperone HslO [Halopseudomonas sabulinigri]|tara:strand:- start:1904 stop:2785 length:882 start_codon:yes stop_codon:yes gene_type:complete